MVRDAGLVFKPPSNVLNPPEPWDRLDSRQNYAGPPDTDMDVIVSLGLQCNRWSCLIFPLRFDFRSFSLFLSIIRNTILAV